MGLRLRWVGFLACGGLDLLAAVTGVDLGIKSALFLLLFLLLGKLAALESELLPEFLPKSGGASQPCTLPSCSLDAGERSLSD